MIEALQAGERYKAEVSATAAGFARVAYLSVPWVRNAVKAAEAGGLPLNTMMADTFYHTSSLEAVTGSLYHLLPGNGIALRAATEEARAILARTCYPEIDELFGEHPQDGTLVLNAKIAVASSFDNITAPINIEDY